MNQKPENCNKMLLEGEADCETGRSTASGAWLWLELNDSGLTHAKHPWHPCSLVVPPSDPGTPTGSMSLGFDI